MARSDNSRSTILLFADLVAAFFYLAENRYVRLTTWKDPPGATIFDGLFSLTVIPAARFRCIAVVHRLVYRGRYSLPHSSLCLMYSSSK